MEPLIAVMFPAPPGWVAAASGALSVVVFAASAGVMIQAVREARPPWLSSVRTACVVVSALLLVSTALAWPARWALVLSCLAFLFTLEAIAIAFGTAEPRNQREFAWWPEFEAAFWRYVRDDLDDASHPHDFRGRP